jgi:hypothetical protein
MFLLTRRLFRVIFFPVKNVEHSGYLCSPFRLCAVIKRMLNQQTLATLATFITLATQTTSGLVTERPEQSTTLKQEVKGAEYPLSAFFVFLSQERSKREQH